MRRSQARALMALTLVVLTMAIAIGPVLDFDLFWHLAVGRWIAIHHALPRQDPLAAGHRPWVPYSWLFELAMLGLYRGAGWVGIELYRLGAALGVLAATRWTMGQVRRGPLSPGVMTGLAFLGMCETISERAWMFSMALTVLSLGVALRAGQGKTRPALALVPLYALCGNIHVQFVYGLLVLGWGVLTAPRAARLRMAVVACACAAATVVGPLGIQAWTVAWGYARNRDGLGLMQELTPPVFDSPWQKGSLLLQVLAGVGLLIALRHPRRRRRALQLAPLLVFALVSFARLRRDLWLANVVAAVTLCALVRMPQLRRLERRLARPALVGPLLGLSVVALLATLPTGTPHALEEALAASYPVEAARDIGRHPEWTGPLYHDINWAGFLAWALPEREIIIDGRTNLHSDARLRRNAETWWHTAVGPDPDFTRAGVIVANRSNPLTAVLEHDRGLQRVHDDPTAEVFLRTNPPETLGVPPRP